MPELEWLAKFSEAMYLLARFNPPSMKGWLRGRIWERWMSSTLTPTGAWAIQGPGSLTLFGSGSASGLAHELDGAGARNSATLICEAKSYDGCGPSKMDLFYFDRKTFDLYVARHRAGETGPHWRVLVSTGPLDDALRRYCFLYGIIAIDCELIPLPMLLRMASRQSADQFFPDTILSELVRLSEVACGPLESRFVPDGPDHLRFNTRVLNQADLDDLLWIQKTVTEDLLELLDQEKPGYFEDRAENLVARLGLKHDSLRDPQSFTGLKADRFYQEMI